MTFVNFSLLAGTALIVVPIVLHLIMRRKPRVLEFPALRFIQRRHDTNRRRLRLRHLLLLALRAAAIGLLAMALARPSIKLSGALGSQEAPVAAILAFDTSMRMEYRHENRTRLEAAQEIGQWLLAQLPANSQIAVLDTRLGEGAFQADLGAAQHRVETLQTVANSQPIAAVVEEGLRLLDQSELARNLARKEIYIFTDLSRAGWPADTSGLRRWAAKVPHVGLYVIDVGVADPVDFGLGDPRLSSQVISTRSPLGIDADLVHSGPEAQRTVELYLLDAKGQPQRRGAETASLASGQSRQLPFRVEGLDVGTHQGYLQILGEDGLSRNDRRYFTVSVQPPWRVLIAAPQPVETHAVFLSQAPAPTSFRQSGRARFDCEVIGLENLAGQALESYAAVCVLDPPPLEPDLWQKLRDFAADGHGVGIFLGRRAEPTDAFNEPAAQALLPGRLAVQARRPDADVALAPRDFEHPILAGLRGYAGTLPWHYFPVFRYWQLEGTHPGVHVVVPFSDGRPAILERPLGKGRVLTTTTPVSDRLSGPDPWNVLPAGEDWPFVALLQQMGDYLVGSSEQQLNYFAGQTCVLRLSPQRPFHSYALSGPDGLELRLTPDPKQDALVVTSTDLPGNYRVRAGGTRDGVELGFSVNLAVQQTQLDRMTDQQLAEVFGPLPYRVARSRDQIDRDVSAARVGRELFPLLIALVAVVLAMEHVMANRFYRGGNA